MFESALGRSEASSSRLGTGAVLSAGVHALFAALVFIIPGKTRAQQEVPQEALVIQIAQPKVDLGGSPGPAAPAPQAAAPKPAQSRPAPVRIQDKPDPEPQPQEPEPPQPTNSDPAPGADTATPAGPPGGGAGGGTGNGPGGGTGGNGPGTGNGNGSGEPAGTYTVINWNASMERPVQTAGPAHPEYPRNAMLQHREGVVLAKCRITTDGSVRDCSIIKGDVMLQQAALDALAQQRYRPLMYGGVPVSVWYNFRFTFKLQ